jgi:hypothetical protein
MFEAFRFAGAFGFFIPAFAAVTANPVQLRESVASNARSGSSAAP